MVKFILGVVIGILAVILAVQNTESVTYHFLAWSFAASRSLVVLIVLGVGIIAGWLLTGIRRFVKRKQRK